MTKFKTLLSLILICFFTLGETDLQAKTFKRKTEHTVSKRSKRKIKKRIKRNNRRKYKCPTFASKKMEEAIKIYSNQYGVPEKIAFNIAYTETGYKGPHHKSYNPARVSRCGALGPMQLMPRYAKKYLPSKRSPRDLLHDVYLNVEISMKMLASLKDRFGTWERAVAAYATGNPRPNFYSRRIMLNDFSERWVTPKNPVMCLPDPPCFYNSDSPSHNPDYSFWKDSISVIPF